MLTADHANPTKSGGRDFVSNIQLLCGLCNPRNGASFEDHGDLLMHLELMDKTIAERLRRALLPLSQL